MATTKRKSVDDFLEELPAPHEIKERLIRSESEVKLLKELLRLSLRRDQTMGVPEIKEEEFDD